MKRFLTDHNLINAIPLTIGVILISVTVKDTRNSMLAFVCFSIIVAGFMYVLFSPRKTTVDVKNKKRQLIKLAMTLILTAAFIVLKD